MNMPRFELYLGIAAAVAFGILVVVLANGGIIERSYPVAPPRASSTSLSVVPIFSLPPLTFPSLPQETERPLHAASTSPAPVVLLPSPALVPRVASSSSAAPAVSAPLLAGAITLRGALVNIICRSPKGSNLRSVSGSGVMIRPEGVILTNAHVGQFFLLTDRGVSCIIRTGSPAADAYRAALLYISPPWLRANANVLTESNPKGTGKYDFAFLAVTESATALPLPASFPSIALGMAPPPAGTPIAVASYGAQFLTADQIRSTLFPTVVFGTVKEVLTFALDTIDVLALGGSAAAQEGSSGGGVVDKNGELLGVLTTSSMDGDTASRNLNAITASYIRSEYENETGTTLDRLFAEPLTAAAHDFSLQAPDLESILTTHLP